MYYWKIDKLIDALKNDTLSEKQKALYLFCCSVIYPCVFLLFHYVNLIAVKYTRDMNYIQEIIASILYVLCLFITFKINSKIDNKNFITRFVSIDFVYSVRIFPFFIIFYIFIRATISFSDLHLENPLSGLQRDLVDLTLWVSYFLILNLKIISGFKKLSK